MADDAQELMIELAEQISEATTEIIMLRAILDHDIYGDTERAIRRAQQRCHEVAEGIGRAADTRERLTRALRATGRL
jgi:hypothetical protein